MEKGTYVPRLIDTGEGFDKSVKDFETGLKEVVEDIDRNEAELAFEMNGKESLKHYKEVKDSEGLKNEMYSHITEYVKKNYVKYKEDIRARYEKALNNGHKNFKSDKLYFAFIEQEEMWSEAMKDWEKSSKLITSAETFAKEMKEIEERSLRMDIDLKLCGRTTFILDPKYVDFEQRKKEDLLHFTNEGATTYDFLAYAYLTVNKKTDEMKMFVEEIECYDEEYRENDGIVDEAVEEIKLSKEEEAFFRKVYEEEKGKSEKTKKSIELD